MLTRPRRLTATVMLAPKLAASVVETASVSRRIGMMFHVTALLVTLPCELVATHRYWMPSKGDSRCRRGEVRRGSATAPGDVGPAAAGVLFPLIRRFLGLPLAMR